MTIRVAEPGWGAGPVTPRQGEIGRVVHWYLS